MQNGPKIESVRKVQMVEPAVIKERYQKRGSGMNSNSEGVKVNEGKIKDKIMRIQRKLEKRENKEKDRGGNKCKYEQSFKIQSNTKKARKTKYSE